MSSSVWHVKGKDPFWAYRLPGDEPAKYVYHQNKIAFQSPLERIPASVFHQIIAHYSTGKYECGEVDALEQRYQISNIRQYEELREIFPKATIAAGMQY